jgi:hypothetical protein
MRVSNRVLAAGGLSAALFLIVLPDPAMAQQWEIELHGGGLFPNTPSQGSGQLPAPQAAYAIGPQFSSRSVPSWYFGDGTALFNSMAGSLRPYFQVPGITPLDPVLTGPAARRSSSGSFGLRLARRLNSRLSAELSVDYDLARLEMTSGSLAEIEASRASFGAAWNRLPYTFPIANLNVTSTATVQSGGRQIRTTGALNIRLRTTGKLVPYATLGAGIASSLGEGPRVDLIGDYHFDVVAPLPPTAPMHQTDTVSIRYSSRNAVVGVLGLGFKYDLSPRWGLRADIREHLGGFKTIATLDATPTNVTSSDPRSLGLLFGFRGSPVVLVDNRGTRGNSSLGGTSVVGFRSFEGSGTQSQLNVTVGLSLRF